MSARNRSRSPRALGPKDLRWTCPPSWIPSTSRKEGDGDPIAGLMSQDRAVAAIEMALTVEAPGYNVFVTGIEGTERNETLRKLLGRLRLAESTVRDHVYVHNFADPLRPRHLALSAGRGRALREALRDWVRALRREIPRRLESEDQMRRRRQLLRKYRDAEQQLFDRISEMAEEAGLALVEVEEEDGSLRHDIYLRAGDEVHALEEVESIPAEFKPGKQRLRLLTDQRDRLLDELRRAQRQARAIGARLVREVRGMDQESVRSLVEDLATDLKEELEASSKLAAWLDDCARHAIENLDLFRRGGNAPAGGEGGDEELDDGEPDFDGEHHAQRQPGFEVFEANLVRSADEHASFVERFPSGALLGFEHHPTPTNLFGTVETRELARGPGHYHLAVRPGSMLAADGGCLVLDARDVIREPATWRSLKRSLQTQTLEVRVQETSHHPHATGVRPEPIELDLKVVLVGENVLFETLHEADRDFPLIFKVRAEFDDTVPLSRLQVGRLARLIRGLGQRDDLLPFGPSGLQSLCERAVREAGRRNRLSARVSLLSDYAREASYYAQKSGRERVGRESFEEAEKNFRRQHSLEHEWHNRLTLEDVYQLSTDGERIGVVNALTVITLGPLGFGRPTRVSSVVSAGEESYVCIDREVDLSGPIHTKGVLMLESFLRNRFGQKRTMPFKASLTFDQSYGPVDGDSASSTELYALLSALAEVPLRQELAVTGAVDLFGDVLSVGGVNEKIEGYYELCAERGLTGTQGVIIPMTNLDDLMLDREVVGAVRDGRFQVWAVRTIDEGIELLSGMPAGERQADGKYPAESFMGRVEARLDRFEKEMRRDDDKDEEKDAGDAAQGDKSSARKGD